MKYDLGPTDDGSERTISPSQLGVVGPEIVRGPTASAERQEGLRQTREEGSRDTLDVLRPGAFAFRGHS